MAGRRKTEQLHSGKYCLTKFLGILTGSSLMTEDEVNELKGIVFTGSKYEFPVGYDGSDVFSLYSEPGKYNNFCDLASNMVYTKKTVSDGGKMKSGPMNSNTYATLIGRLLAQYYRDGLYSYEEFFERLLYEKNCDRGAIFDALKKEVPEVIFREDVSDSRKLVAYMLRSFHPANLSVYDENEGRFTGETPACKIMYRGVYDIFWQIAFARNQDIRSKFEDDFPSIPPSWIERNWPSSESRKVKEYRVPFGGGTKNVMAEKDPAKVPEAFSPETIVTGLIDNYISSCTSSSADPNKRILDLGMDYILEYISRIPSDKRDEEIRKIMNLMMTEQDAMEPDGVKSEKFGGGKTDEDGKFLH